MENVVKIPSDMSNIFRVENFIEALSEKLNLGDELIGNISVAVVEAVSNAIQHGNKNDVTKIVRLESIVHAKELVFIVSDEGSGFIIEDVPDPTLPENLENIKGRGLFLINHLSDIVEYENNGSRIKIHFNL